jgi:membrane protease YdiL (CAAX protease family)
VRINFDPHTNRLIAPAFAGRSPSYLRPALYVLLEEALVVGYSTIAGIVLAFVYLFPAIADGQVPDPQALIADLTDKLLTGWTGLALALPQFLLIIGLTWFWVKVIERRPFRTIGLAMRRPAGAWARGMLLGVFFFGLSVFLAGVSGNLRFEGFAPAGIGQALLWTGVTLAFYLIQGPAEEVMTRGYLLPALAARGGPWLGVAVSALIFAAGHLLNPNVSLLSILNLFLYGIFAALYALREGGLWGVFGFHTAWNWVQGSVLGIAVSGANLSPAPLLTLTTTGPDWWAGGAFGLEGGLAVTIGTLLGIVALLYMPRLRALVSEQAPPAAD